MPCPDFLGMTKVVTSVAIRLALGCVRTDAWVARNTMRRQHTWGWVLRFHEGELREQQLDIQHFDFEPGQHLRPQKLSGRVVRSILTSSASPRLAVICLRSFSGSGY